MKLTIRINQNRQDGYTAICPSLPGCVSRGRSKEEAKQKLDEAVRGYIAAVGNTFDVRHELVEA